MCGNTVTSGGLPAQGPMLVQPQDNSDGSRQVRIIDGQFQIGREENDRLKKFIKHLCQQKQDSLERSVKRDKSEAKRVYDASMKTAQDVFEREQASLDASIDKIKEEINEINFRVTSKGKKKKKKNKGDDEKAKRSQKEKQIEDLRQCKSNSDAYYKRNKKEKKKRYQDDCKRCEGPMVQFNNNKQGMEIDLRDVLLSKDMYHARVLTYIGRTKEECIRDTNAPSFLKGLYQRTAIVVSPAQSMRPQQLASQPFQPSVAPPAYSETEFFLAKVPLSTPLSNGEGRPTAPSPVPSDSQVSVLSTPVAHRTSSLPPEESRREVDYHQPGPRRRYSSASTYTVNSEERRSYQRAFSEDEEHSVLLSRRVADWVGSYTPSAQYADDADERMSHTSTSRLESLPDDFSPENPMLDSSYFDSIRMDQKLIEEQMKNERLMIENQQLKQEKAGWEEQALNVGAVMEVSETERADEVAALKRDNEELKALLVAEKKNALVIAELKAELGQVITHLKTELEKARRERDEQGNIVKALKSEMAVLRDQPSVEREKPPAKQPDVRFAGEQPAMPFMMQPEPSRVKSPAEPVRVPQAQRPVAQSNPTVNNMSGGYKAPAYSQASQPAFARPAMVDQGVQTQQPVGYQPSFGYHWVQPMPLVSVPMVPCWYNCSPWLNVVIPHPFSYMFAFGSRWVL